MCSHFYDSVSQTLLWESVVLLNAFSVEMHLWVRNLCCIFGEFKEGLDSGLWCFCRDLEVKVGNLIFVLVYDIKLLLQSDFQCCDKLKVLELPKQIFKNCVYMECTVLFQMFEIWNIKFCTWLIRCTDTGGWIWATVVPGNLILYFILLKEINFR